MHRIHGSTTDISPNGLRAVTKMKATITQRFKLKGVDIIKGKEEIEEVEADAESDCRFCFFWQKEIDGDLKGEWRARFVRHWYEKDKLIPVNPAKVPVLDEEKLKVFPTGYRYLAYCQEETMGVRVMLDMPGHRREPDTASGKKHDQLYWQCKQWVEGEEVDI